MNFKVVEVASLVSLVAVVALDLEIGTLFGQVLFHVLFVQWKFFFILAAFETRVYLFVFKIFFIFLDNILVHKWVSSRLMIEF